MATLKTSVKKAASTLGSDSSSATEKSRAAKIMGAKGGSAPTKKSK